MKVRVLAWNTFGSLVRDKLIAVICAGFLCIVLFMISPLLFIKSLPESSQHAMLVSLVSAIAWLVSGFGSMLAAWASASAVAGEIKSGTILAVMARPVERWEFLLAKFLGVQILMFIYVAAMLALTLSLTTMGGGRMQSILWPLVAYPVVRYALYSALALMLVTRMHPVFAIAIVMLCSAGAGAVNPDSLTGSFLPEVLGRTIYAVLPSFDLLSETRFLTISQAQLKALPWTNHVTTLAYGLDWAVVFFVLAVWWFRRRAL
jgi:ABC-type transport system involved in multi-copper enzyme maturation permease subunit